LLSLLAAAPLAAAKSLAFAQGAADWPSRPVKIIVAFPPGQSTDIATRYLAAQLSDALGQSFFIENRAGASGNIGTAVAAHSAPDGYTLVMGTNATHAMNIALFSNPGYDAEKDFDAVVQTAAIPFAISVGPDVAVNSLTELIALAKAKPDTVDVALPSVTAQLVLEMLKRRGVPLFGVPFKGSADSMNAVLGGHAPVLIDTVAATRIQLGRIKPLAVTTATPLQSMPGVKTASEQGLPEFEMSAWNTLMVPKGIPEEIRSKLAREVRKILDQPQTNKALEDLGFAKAPVRTTAELDAWLREERRKFAELIQAAKMKVQ
jgi:tripartite-type tricarboxylate transporter receptor subunit TctC